MTHPTRSQEPQYHSESICAPKEDLWKRAVKSLVPAYLYMVMILGGIGTAGGLLALLVQGRVKNLRINGKPVETVAEKLTVLGVSLVFLIVGITGLAVRRRMRQKLDIKKNP